MNSKTINPRLILVAGIILFGAIICLVPHWKNFTPIAAMALFSGANFSKKYLAFGIPIAALFISDLILGFHAYLIAKYISFIITVGLGIFIRNKINVGTVLLGSVSASLLFFILTNFAVWIGNPVYPQNVLGFIESFTVGIPFLRNGILGDLCYNTIFFGGFHFAQLKFSALKRV